MNRDALVGKILRSTQAVRLRHNVSILHERKSGIHQSRAADVRAYVGISISTVHILHGIKLSHGKARHGFF